MNTSKSAYYIFQATCPILLNRFAMVIDNLFTPEECARLVAKVESEKEWETAAINVGAGAQVCAIICETPIY
jgi:hypothetical protein